MTFFITDLTNRKIEFVRIRREPRPLAGKAWRQQSGQDVVRRLLDQDAVISGPGDRPGVGRAGRPEHWPAGTVTGERDSNNSRDNASAFGGERNSLLDNERPLAATGSELHGARPDPEHGRGEPPVQLLPVRRERDAWRQPLADHAGPRQLAVVRPASHRNRPGPGRVVLIGVFGFRSRRRWNARSTLMQAVPEPGCAALILPALSPCWRGAPPPPPSVIHGEAIGPGASRGERFPAASSFRPCHHRRLGYRVHRQLHTQGKGVAMHSSRLETMLVAGAAVTGLIFDGQRQPSDRCPRRGRSTAKPGWRTARKVLVRVGDK